MRARYYFQGSVNGYPGEREEAEIDLDDAATLPPNVARKLAELPLAEVVTGWWHVERPGLDIWWALRLVP